MKSIIDGDGKFGFQPLGGIGQIPPEEGISRIYTGNFDGGLRLDAAPVDLPINSCVDMDKARIQAGALLPGFSSTAMSTAASDRIIAIGPHGRFFGGATVTATVRFVAVGGDIALERWNGSIWFREKIQTIAASMTIIKADMISMQDTLIVAPSDSFFITPGAFYWKESTNELLIVDATAAIAPKYMAAFGDRLIFFQSIGGGTSTGIELQSLAWSVDGSILDFSGTGSGQIFLFDNPSDVVDALQGGAQIGNNILAIFRERSIMRGFETGNSAQSIAAVHWIEGLGTDCPFSITPVPLGVCFLGNDGMVYFLTEQTGPVPIGEAIQDEILSKLSIANRVEGVQAGYDYTNRHLWLAVPDAGASTTMKTVFIFDLGRFLKVNEKQWVKMIASNFGGAGIQCMGSTSEALV